MEAGYRLLSTDDSQLARPAASRTTKNEGIRCTSYLLLAALVSSFANVVLWTLTHRTRLEVPLEEPSSYMGLEKLDYDTTEESNLHFHNFPLLATQVSQLQPGHVWEDDSRKLLTSIGTISPDSRHFMLSQGVSTIFQFRAVDFGFERCTLQVSLQNVSGFDGIEVDVWSLDAPRRLQANTLSWATRPPRKRLLQTVQFLPNTSFTVQDSWECKWSSMQTFEFACSEKSERCSIDFWQDPKHPGLGITLLQRSSMA